MKCFVALSNLAPILFQWKNPVVDFITVLYAFLVSWRHYLTNFRSSFWDICKSLCGIPFFLKTDFATIWPQLYRSCSSSYKNLLILCLVSYSKPNIGKNTNSTKEMVRKGVVANLLNLVLGHNDASRPNDWSIIYMKKMGFGMIFIISMTWKLRGLYSLCKSIIIVGNY